MARAIWKGAISFGLVHIPVAVVSATSSQGIDFDWLDERSMEPVGYKRVNKVTGKEVNKENIVKGVQYEKGHYVVLGEDEIRAAHPKSTQTIDIFAFVASDEIPLENIDKPYYLAPDRRGEKVYALLREALTATGKVALAHVVLHSRQHLAALMAIESALVLILLRWPAEVRSLETLELSEAATSPSLSKSEMDMAKRLVEDMTAHWQPKDFHDTFQEKIMQLVDQKVRAGKIEEVETPDAPERRSADVIDLMELLKKSLRGDKTPKQSAGKKATNTKSEPDRAATVKSIKKSAKKPATKKSSSTSSKSRTANNKRAG
jgi:DNA end-binding protein Ku